MAGDRLLSDDLPAPAELLDNRPGATVRKSAGAGPAAGVLGLPLRNDGTVESLAGVLKVAGRRGDARQRARSAARRARTASCSAPGARSTATPGSRARSRSAASSGPIAGRPRRDAGRPARTWPRTGGDFAGNLRVTGHDERGPAAGSRARARPRSPPALRAALRRPHPGGVRLRAARRRAPAPQRGPRALRAGRRPVRRARRSARGSTTPGRIELDGGAADPCGSQTGILGDPLVTNAGTIEKVAGTSPAVVRGGLDNDGAAASRAGELELEGDPAALQAGDVREHRGGVDDRAPPRARFALGPAADDRGPDRR